jgi:DNA-binding transcriptional LysR family regulator
MRHFVAVAEELHFGRAALRLNMAQPPLSQSIQRLELDLGVTLLDRSRRGVELTAAGTAYLTEARRTLAQAELARKVALRAAEQSIDVRISFIGPALYRVLPALMVAFHEAHPGVNIRLYEKTSPEQNPGIMAGDFDIGFVTSGTEIMETSEALLVERSPLVAAIPSDSPLATEGSVTLARLAEEDFISAPMQHAPHGFDAMSMFKSAGVVPRIAQEAAQTNTTLSLVGAGLGCAIVSGTARLKQSRNVSFLKIVDLPDYLRWEMLMIWSRQQRSLPAANFIDIAKVHLSQHPEWLEA